MKIKLQNFFENFQVTKNSKIFFFSQQIGNFEFAGSENKFKHSPESFENAGLKNTNFNTKLPNLFKNVRFKNVKLIFNGPLLLLC